MRYRPILLAGLLGFAILPADPSVAQNPIPVFADADFVSWQFLQPPGDPLVELERSAEGNPYLTVRHRHLDQFNSLKRSAQGSPGARYDPGASGAVDSFSFSGTFRPQFDGFGPPAYAMRSLLVRPALVQGGELFVAQQHLSSWISGESGLGNWLPGFSGTLGATSFFRNRIEEVFPDFSAAGAPMVFGFHLDSAFQTGSQAIADVVFEMDVDDFEVSAVLADPEGLPSIRIEAGAGIAGTGSQATAMFGGKESDFEGTFGVPILLSAAADRPVRYRVQGDRGDVSEWQTISPGFTRVSTWMPADAGQQSYTIFDIEGAVPGSPLRATLFVQYSHDDERRCAGELLALIIQYLTDLIPPPPPAPVGVAASAGNLSAASGELPDFLGTLRAFRDGVMAASSGGRYYTSLFRTWSPDLQSAFYRRPLVFFDLYQSHGAWIEGLASLVAGDGEAFEVTADMSGDLNRILDTLEAGGSPALARAIARERARIDLASIAGLSMEAFWQRVVDRVHPDPCVSDGDGLCIGEGGEGGGGGGRYRVEADWKTPAGDVGRARAVALSGDSGYFWFFDPANVEILTKIVDGCDFNQRIWSYSAGLTNLAVELFVFDTATGRGKSYENPQAASFAPILDSDYLECDAASPIADPVAAEKNLPLPKPEPAPLGAGSCVPGPQTLCLGGVGGDRFRVEADWRTAAGTSGAAQAVPLTGDTGTFWFFHPANIELVVKTIDACGLAGFENFWVFAGGTTDVEVTLRVTDTLRDISKSYRRPLGVPFAPILDSAAFATCP